MNFFIIMGISILILAFIVKKNSSAVVIKDDDINKKYKEKSAKISVNMLLSIGILTILSGVLDYVLHENYTMIIDILILILSIIILIIGFFKYSKLKKFKKDN